VVEEEGVVDGEGVVEEEGVVDGEGVVEEEGVVDGEGVVEEEGVVGEDEMEIFDVVSTAEGEEIAVTPEELRDSDAVDWRALRGGYSEIGYVVVERSAAGELQYVSEVSWLRLRPPASCTECEPDELDRFGWAQLSPAACKAAAELPVLAFVVFVGLLAGGLFQLVSGVRRTRQQRRLAKLPLLRGVLLLSAAMAARVCRTSGGVEHCVPTGRSGARRSGRLGGNSSTVVGGNSSSMAGGNSSGVAGGNSSGMQARGARLNASLCGAGSDLRSCERRTSSGGGTRRSRTTHNLTSVRVNGGGAAPIGKPPPTDVSLGGDEHRLPQIEYDGYEDARTYLAPRAVCETAPDPCDAVASHPSGRPRARNAPTSPIDGVYRTRVPYAAQA
jgi:hypothetical protein